MQRAAFDLIRAHFRLPVITGLPRRDQQSIFSAIMHLFSGLSSQQYSQRTWPPPQHSVLPQVIMDTKSFLEDAWKGPTKQGFIDAAIELVKTADVETVLVPCIGTLTLGLSDSVASEASAVVIPELFSRLTQNPLPTISLSLRALLRNLSTRYPQVFYKPLFACAASDKEDVVKTHLVSLHIISTLVGPSVFYLRDPEMITVALMADVGTGGSHDPNWATARLGQTALLLELVSLFVHIRASKDKLVGLALH
jgi:hypothetical protein